MPAAFASHVDVEAAWRALTATEQAVADVKLALASAIVRAEVPTVDDRIADGTLDPVLVKGIVVEMAVRALRNPEGIRQTSVAKSIDDFSTTTTEVRDQALSAGAVYLAEDERRLLAGTGRRRAFSIAPTSEAVTEAHLAAVAEHRANRPL